MRLNKKGFTLAELLIVVAIIAVLTAIAIPVFTSQLEKAREATDLSNIRGYYGEITPALLTGDLLNEDDTITVSGHQATLTTDLPREEGDEFTVTVEGVAIQQRQNGWQTRGSEVAGITVGGDDAGVADWTNNIGTPCTVTYTFTLADDGDYDLTSVTFS